MLMVLILILVVLSLIQVLLATCLASAASDEAEKRHYRLERGQATTFIFILACLIYLVSIYEKLPK